MASTELRSTPTIAEHTLVWLTIATDTEEGRLPVGARGTVVGIYQGGRAYEVEFFTPVHAVVTLPPEAVEP